MWTPALGNSPHSKYQQIADQLAEAIKTGQLSAGERLPTVRQLAAALGVTVGTVQRAYRLSEQRRLVQTRTGSGTYVRHHHSPEPRQRLLPSAPCGGLDMTTNAPVRVDVDWDFTALTRAEDLHWVMANYIASEGVDAHRQLFCDWLRQERGVDCAPEQLLLSSGGQQSLAIALACLTRPGDTLMVEALTYPGLINLARILGLKLRSVAMDQQGVLPEAFAQACRDHNAQVMVCMPNLHNPTSITLSRARREALVEVASRYDITLIEDDLYLRAADAVLPTLYALAPERTLYISALSKVLAPGLRVSIMAAPQATIPALISTAQTFNWMPAPYMVELASRLLESSLYQTVLSRRVQATAERVALLREAFAGLPVKSDPASTHAWLLLPYPWQAADYALAAQQMGIFITPSSYFSAGEAAPPQAVRIALGNCPNIEQLRRGLHELARLAKRPPGALSYHF